MKKVFPIFCCIILLASCYGPQTLQKSLNKRDCPLGYLHDTPIVNKKNDVNVFFEISDLSDTTNFTYVREDNKEEIFLIIYYNFKHDFTVGLGKNSMVPHLKEFIENSFSKESERSGKYFTNDSSKNVNYFAKIEILDYKSETKYFRKSSGLASSYSSIKIEVKPSTGYIRLRTKIMDTNDKVILSKEYYNTVSTDFIKSRLTSETEINNYVMQNMTETLAECIKQCISEIVIDINDEIEI